MAGRRRNLFDHERSLPKSKLDRPWHKRSSARFGGKSVDQILAALSKQEDAFHRLRVLERFAGAEVADFLWHVTEARLLDTPAGPEYWDAMARAPARDVRTVIEFLRRIDRRPDVLARVGGSKMLHADWPCSLDALVTRTAATSDAARIALVEAVGGLHALREGVVSVLVRLGVVDGSALADDFVDRLARRFVASIGETNALRSELARRAWSREVWETAVRNALVDPEQSLFDVSWMMPGELGERLALGDLIRIVHKTQNHHAEAREAFHRLFDVRGAAVIGDLRAEVAKLSRENASLLTRGILTIALVCALGRDGRTIDSELVDVVVQTPAYAGAHRAEALEHLRARGLVT